MSTRGFLGFKLNNNDTRKGNIFGVYNHHYSYYSYMGVKILNAYKTTTKKDFELVFNSYEWVEDCEDCYEGDALSLIKGYCSDDRVPNDVDFLDNGLFCEYAYIYNIENDSLEIYRGCFNFPEKENQIGSKTVLGKSFYTHKVYTVTRDSDFDKVEYMFNNINTIINDDDMYQTTNGKYPEELFMKNIENYILVD